MRVDLSDFKRILSNIMNNAADAIREHGKIGVSLQQDASRVRIVIEDNGKGIPEERIRMVMEDGATSDKGTGHGLGLSPANARLNDWGGEIHVSSKPGIGTKVSIELPAVPAPAWFVSQLEVAPLSSVVICDDDVTIHHVWDNRLKSFRAENIGVDIIHVSNEDELRAWHAKHHKLTTMYLVDYELSGTERNGVDLIQSLGIQVQAVLVTSRSEESGVIEKCEGLGIKLLPKSLASWVPLVTKEEASSVDGVLIEDDEALGIAWKTSAETRGKRLQVFRSGAPFLTIAHTVHRATPIYIDANLGDAERGEEVAKALHELGFQNLYLTTGEPIEERPPWLKEILDKTPPWLPRLVGLSG